MSSLIEKIAKKNGTHLRPLIDLPPEEESRFCPNSFMPRKFLEHFRGLVKKESRSYILVPPPNVAGYESDGHYRRAVTWAMVMERRRKRQAVELEQIRSDYDVTYQKPLYVWVFWCPGINNFFFRGWWTYFVGHGCDYRGGGYKGEVAGKLKDDLLRLFPLIEPSLFETNWDEWMRRFVKKYRRGTWCGKPQGKSLIWAEVQGNSIKRLLSRAEWPDNLKANGVNECG